MEDATRVWFNLLTAVLVLVVAIGSVILSVRNQEAETRRWEQFSIRHHCTLVGHRDAQYVHGYSHGRSTRSTIPAQNGYQCDDGVTYWR